MNCQSNKKTAECFIKRLTLTAKYLQTSLTPVETAELLLLVHMRLFIPLFITYGHHRGGLGDCKGPSRWDWKDRQGSGSKGHVRCHSAGNGRSWGDGFMRLCSCWAYRRGPGGWGRAWEWPLASGWWAWGPSLRKGMQKPERVSRRSDGFAFGVCIWGAQGTPRWGALESVCPLRLMLWKETCPPYPLLL